MQLVEKHIINKNHKFYKECDRLSLLSKNLYNSCNYIIRQEFIKTGIVLNYYELNKICIQTNQSDYRNLPSRVSNGTLRLLDKNWVSFLNAHRDFIKNPLKYLGKPKIPKYKDKLKGRFVVCYEKGAISKKCLLKYGLVNLSKTSIKIQTKTGYNDLQAVRIVPRNNYFVIEVIYNQEIIAHDLNKENYLGIDIGVNNLASCACSKTGYTFIINGKPLKSINQYYNKKKAKLQRQLKINIFSSNKITQLTNKRNNKVNDFLHKSSRTIIENCLANDVGVIIIGKNKNWKQNTSMSGKNNQNFIQIPFDKFISMIKYKAMMVGIEVILIEESYTSKCSFIDDEKLCKHNVYLGKRIERGLFKSKDGILLNADINGAFNIIRKVVPLFRYELGNRGCAVHPKIIQS